MERNVWREPVIRQACVLLSICMCVQLSTAADSNAVAADEIVLDFHVINRLTKEPLPDVTLEIQVNGKEIQTQKIWKEKTDAEGKCLIRFSDFSVRAFRIYPQKEGFVTLRIFWRGDPTPPEIPETYTVAMEPGTTIGGTVQNEQGEPIEGVIIRLHYYKDDPAGADNARVNIVERSDLIKTDSQGQWRYDRMPSEIDMSELRIFVTHPDYISDILSLGFIPMPITPQPPIEKLRDLSAVMVMKEGLKVTGMVTDMQGEPIVGAKIYDMEDYWFRKTKPFAETDAQGQFQSNADPDIVTLTVQAPGYAPDLRVVTIKAGMSPVEFHLEPGRIIEGKVTDQAGKPIEEAWVSAEEWRNNRRRVHLETRTDAEGNFKITDAPADEVTFSIGKQGFMMLEKYPMKSDMGKYNITLRPTLKVHGKVVEAQTGQPINKFTVTNGFDHEDGRAPQWDKLMVRTFTDGQYEMEYQQEIFTYRIRIDAEGYQSAISDRIRPEEISESNMVCDFELNKAFDVTGTVLAPNGMPLSSVDVVFMTHWVHIKNGQIDSRSSKENLILQTDANGKFHFEPPVTPYVIIVLCEQGYARVTPDEFTASKTITLSPWGRIEGTLRIGARPGTDKEIIFMPEPRQDQESTGIHFEYDTKTDENGHFVFHRILPGKGMVARAIPMDNRGRRFSHSISVEIKSGETARVQIGGTGRPVIGKVLIPDLIKDTFDWQHTDHSLRNSSAESFYSQLALNFDEDGSFRTDDVPAGDYTLYVTAYGPPPNSRIYRGERIGMLSRVFTVPEMPGGRSDEPLDLGELKFEVINKSRLIPSLIGKPIPDLSEIDITPSMEQTEGKMILVCFWDINQRPSRRFIGSLAEQAVELTEKGVIVVAIQASKVEQGTLDEWLQENNISFPVGMVRSDEERIRFKWGIRALPWLILTDSKHIVSAEGFRISELNEKIEQ